MLFSKLSSRFTRNSLLISRHVYSVRNSDPVKVLLPPQHADDKGKITLVLDLDETLVNSKLIFGAVEVEKRESEKYASFELGRPFKFKLNLSNGARVLVHCRPHLKPFMQYIADKYEPVVFTAALPVYANAVLDEIDPDRKIFRHRLFREDCTSVDELGGNHTKDLRVLGRDLRRTVLVDNSPIVFFHQPDNGLPIKSFYKDDDDDVEDTELLKLMEFLPQLEQRAVDGDIRPVLQQEFNTKELIEKETAMYILN